MTLAAKPTPPDCDVAASDGEWRHARAMMFVSALTIESPVPI
jgi:hypothetical protein